MAIPIQPITEGNAAQFNAAVGVMAREKMYLLLTNAPPLEGSVAFVRKMSANRFPLLGAFDGETIARGRSPHLPHAIRLTLRPA